MKIKQFWILFALLAFCSLAECADTRKIPAVFHWIHLGNKPFSKEETQAIRSWQRTHPKWVFKIWTNAPCSVNQAIVCPVDPYVHDVEQWKKKVLQSEGGVWAHPDLIGCKTLDPLTFSCESFISTDGSSFIGCAKGCFEQKRIVLPVDFILPDQIFTTDVSASPLSGACFWKFRDYPALTEKLRQIQAWRAEEELIYIRLKKRLVLAKKACFVLIPLLLINGWMGCILFSRLRRQRFARWIPHAKTALKYGVPAAVLCGGAFAFLPYKSTQSNDFFYLSEADKKPRTSEDWSDLQTYRQLFSKSFEFLSKPATGVQIPHVIHFIWGGEKPFPAKSKKNVRSWMAHHPGWTIKFWTDDPTRSIPVPGMEKHLFGEIALNHIGTHFPTASNWGERSDLLRYEILNQEGGIYADHDIECFRSFEPLSGHFTFFAALEPLHPSPLDGRHTIVTNCLIGAQRGHPILFRAMQEVNKRWELATRLFPCEDRDSSLLRTLMRTFDSFHSAVHESIHSENILILPPIAVFADHFSRSLVSSARSADCLFANHQWENGWFKDLPASCPYNFANRLSTHANSLSKIVFFALKWNAIILGGFCTLLSAIWIWNRRRIHAQKTLPASFVSSSAQTGRLPAA